jgi:hypothetical protein
LRAQARALIDVLSEQDVLSTRTRTDLLELIVDGYAHVLALDVERRRLEREIARLAQSGDPDAAEELRELSGLLTEVANISERLRGLLDAVRARERQGA